MTLQGNTTKERSYDRVLVLQGIPGEKTKDSKGLIDPRLFNGDNKLHATMDTQTCNWYFKYEQGGLPEPLKGQYTSFNKMLEHARNYFKTRNVEITEVID